MPRLGPVLRERSTDGASPPVTTMELFFDLVYVFAITQLSHRLLSHLSWHGAVQTGVLFLAVWWAWNYTAWATNWIDPDRPVVRTLMLVLMAISLVMSAAIPEAFGQRAGTFVAAYVTLQLLRSAFMVAAFTGHDPVMRRNYAQLLAWSAIAAVGWVVGAFLDGDARLAVWAFALVLDLGAPLHSFALPGLGATDMSRWSLAGGHLAERCRLVLLIALGESLLVLGATFGELEWTAAVVVAVAAGFVSVASLWWLYFADGGAEAEQAFEDRSQATRIGRGAYAYGHAVMVGGIIAVAVAIERVVAHPTGDTPTATVLVTVGGVGLYLVGHGIYRHALSGRVPPVLAAGLLGLVVLVPVGLVAPPLVLATGTALLAGAVAAGAPRGAAPA